MAMDEEMTRAQAEEWSALREKGAFRHALRRALIWWIPTAILGTAANLVLEHLGVIRRGPILLTVILLFTAGVGMGLADFRRNERRYAAASRRAP